MSCNSTGCVPWFFSHCTACTGGPPSSLTGTLTSSTREDRWSCSWPDQAVKLGGIPNHLRMCLLIFLSIPSTVVICTLYTVETATSVLAAGRAGEMQSSLPLENCCKMQGKHAVSTNQMSFWLSCPFECYLF